MGTCRSCNAEVKPYQIYCPNCGLKHPLLEKEDLQEFEIFKKKFRYVFPLLLTIISILFILFVVKVPVMQPVSYDVKQISPETGSEEKTLGCTEKEFEYTLNYVKAQVFANVLQIKSNIENLEDEQGTFGYTVKITHKLWLKEQQKSSTVLLGPYESKTVYTQFEDVTYPDEVEYDLKVEPPLKKVCETKKEDFVTGKKEEITKTRQEKTYISVFKLILEKID